MARDSSSRDSAAGDVEIRERPSRGSSLDRGCETVDPPTPPGTEPDRTHEPARAASGAEHAEEQRRGPGILHGHAEFHGEKLDLYSDGTRWVSGDALRTAQTAKEHKPEAPRPGITDIPGMRDQGRSVTGERPDDAADLPPDRKELLEADDSKLSRVDRFIDRLEEEDTLSDFHDTTVEQVNAWQQVLDARPPGQAVQTHNDSPHVLSSPQGHWNAGDIAGAGIMTGVLLAEVGRRIHGMLSHRKEVE